MDIRQTLVVHSTFEQMLNELKENGRPAALLFDEQGLTRHEGTVTQLREEAGIMNVHLSDGKIIPLKAIVAVNGVFLSDYSEC